MKKIAFVFLISIVFAMTGCQTNPGVKNGNGTPAVSLPDNINTAEKDNTVSAHSLSDGQRSASGDVIEIKEKMFIAQTNDVYFNAGDYLGKTIKYEGIFSVYEAPETGKEYYSVIRYGPGCCGIDANAGFEVIWNDSYPEQGDWVEAVGVLEEYIEDGYKYLHLSLSSLTVMTERGAEYVSQ